MRESIGLEDRRLDIASQRTELAARALELDNEQDQRQADYAVEELDPASGRIFAAILCWFAR